jgi:hypothetical protein
MTNALVARLKAIAELLQYDPRVGEADRRWLRARIDHGDWMDSDVRLLSEMLPPTLRRCLLDDRGDESADG